MATLDEVLVDLVGDGVSDSCDESGQLATERSEEQRAEDRELGHVRGLPEHRVPVAQARAEARDRGEREDDGGPDDHGQPERKRPRGRHRPMIGSPQRHAAREPGANPGRSRRCEGSCFSAETTGLRGWEGGGGGSPESEDLPRRRKSRTPRGRRIRVPTTHHPRGCGRARRGARNAGARRARQGARGRQDDDDLRLRRADARRPGRTR